MAEYKILLIVAYYPIFTLCPHIRMNYSWSHWKYIL